MNRWRSVMGSAVVAGILAIAQPASGQAQGFLLDAYAGVGLPSGALNDLQKAGFSGGIGLGYVFNRYLGVRADIAGEWLKSRELLGQVPAVPELEGIDTRLYHYDASLIINVADPGQMRWIFAFDLGVGATTVNFAESSGGPGVNGTTRFTLPFGLALGYMVSREIGIFVRGRSYIVFMPEDRFGSSTWTTFPIWAGFGIRAG